ncbi:phage replisome organizer [Serratia quinivorans]|uniref:phage replisome organizer n=1 Tax=Serratia quinivorans TaxID=137545 RepID=UPI0021BD6774|nr:phage replisome organizer [Serratia quinivorans]
MANSWLRLWHDMPNDPKWRTIAKVSGQPIALVQAVYLQLLVSASQNPVTDETGVTSHIVTVTNEDISSALDVTESDVARVTSAMQGRVLNGNTISGWDKRQALFSGARNNGKPAKTGAERTKACRDRKKQKELEKRNVTMSNVTGTTGNDVTPQIRKEEIREEVKEELKNTMSVSEKTPNQTRPADDKKYPNEFETLWREYPKREGSNSKSGAFRNWKARRREGTSDEIMLAAVRRYRAYCQAEGMVGTKFVKLAQTFLGPDHEFDNPWEVNPGGKHYGQNIPGYGESIAERQLREGREQWLREQHNGGLSGVAPVGPHDQNLQQPVDCEEWQSTLGPLGATDWGDDQ